MGWDTRKKIQVRPEEGGPSINKNSQNRFKNSFALFFSRFLTLWPLQYRLHLKVAGTVFWYALPGTAPALPVNPLGSCSCQGDEFLASRTSGARARPPRDVMLPHAAPPPGAPQRLPLTGRRCLTILTPSSEPMAGTASDPSARVARCPTTARANYSAEEAGRKPSQANNSRKRGPPLFCSKAEPGLARSWSAACTWPSLGDGGPRTPRERPS